MATFSGVPHVSVTKTIFPTNPARTTTVNIATSWADAESKTVIKDPPYEPGVFNIKPYTASRTKTYSEASGQVLSNTWKRSDGVVFQDNITLSDHCRTNSFTGISHIPPSTAVQETLAVQGALAKLNESQWDAAMDLAEIGGTFDLLKDAINGLKNGAKGLPGLVKKLLVPQLTSRPGKVDLRRTAKSLQKKGESGSKAAADAWLTYRYGVMPLILSIQDALELLEAQLEKAGKTIRTKRRRPAQPAVKKSWKGSYSQSANYEQEWNARIEGIVYYKRVLDQTLQSALGFAPEKLPELAWELTTLSFVWDWFFNIGDFLAALRPKVGIELLGTSVSVKMTGTTSVTQLFGCNEPGKMMAAKPFFYTTESFKRTVNPGGIFIPQFSGLDGMTIARWADASSLALKPIIKLLKQAR